MKLLKVMPRETGGKPSYGQKPCPCPVEFTSRDLAATNPLSKQFAPQEGELLPQHQKMAGMS